MKEKRYEKLFSDLATRLLDFEPADLILMSDIIDLVHELKNLSPVPEITGTLFEAAELWLDDEFNGIHSDNAGPLLTRFLDLMIGVFTQAPQIMEAGLALPDWMDHELKEVAKKMPKGGVAAVKRHASASYDGVSGAGNNPADAAFPFPDQAQDAQDQQPPDVMAVFIHEGRERLGRAQAIILDIENKHNPDLTNELFRVYHTIKGEAGFLGFPTLGGLTHQLESLLDRFRQGHLEFDDTVADLLLEGNDIAKNLLEDAALHGIQTQTAGCSDCEAFVVKLTEWTRTHIPPLGDIMVSKGLLKPEQVQRVLEKQKESSWQKKFGEITIEEKLLSPKDVESVLVMQHEGSGRQKAQGNVPGEKNQAVTAPEMIPPASGEGVPQVSSLGTVPAPSQPAGTAKAGSSGTQNSSPAEELVNVKAGQIRFLIDMIGELLITLQQLDETDRNVMSARKISRNLQYAAMQLGTVKIGALFSVMKRVVRDAAKQAGKDFDLVLEGEEIEVDRNLVERLNEPLMHLVRNSISHGLEASPEDRTKAGKSPRGAITLRAERKGHQVIISVMDDGRGLQAQRILEKAIEKGLTTREASQNMSVEEIRDFIFKPGFSTAEQVDKLSGRGVGMDVVRTMVESMRGNIHIDSVEGEYTRIHLSFPINMAIIEGMIIRLAGRHFVIPVSNIVETMEFRDEMFHQIREGIQVLSLRGETMPVLNLASWFGLEPAPEGSRNLGIIVESKDRRYAFLVHEIISKREVVIKPLGPLFAGLRGISSGTILQKGRIGLVIDVDEIVRTE